MYINGDKSQKFYTLGMAKYENLLTEAITDKFKKASLHQEECINKEAVKLQM